MSRLYQFPGTEVVDLAALIFVSPLQTELRLAQTINPAYKANDPRQSVLSQEKTISYFITIILEGGITRTIRNLSRDEAKAEAYREALINAWARHLHPIKEVFNQLPQGSQWPTGYGSPTDPNL